MFRNACAPAVLRPLLAAAAVVVVAGCATPAVSPPPPTTSAPSLTTAGTPTASPSASPSAKATGRAAGPSSTRRVTRPAPAPAVTLATFAGTWIGHTRTLTVSASGSAHETVGDGCCTPEIDMTFRLSNPRGTGAAHATATVTVTAVALWAVDGPQPKIGQRGTVTLVDGVLTESLGDVTFCDRPAATRGVCGA